MEFKVSLGQQAFSLSANSVYTNQIAFLEGTIVSTTENDYFLISAKAVRGFSGCPVVDKELKFLGMIFATNAQDFNCKVCSTRTIKFFLEVKTLKEKAKEPEPQKDPEEVVYLEENTGIKKDRKFHQGKKNEHFE